MRLLEDLLPDGEAVFRGGWCEGENSRNGVLGVLLVWAWITPAEAVAQMQEKCQTILDEYWAKADRGVFGFPNEFHSKT